LRRKFCRRRAEWCGQSRPAVRWRSRSFGLVAPVRESGTVFGGTLAVLVLREPVRSLQ
jgi:hypothetical protein